MSRVAKVLKYSLVGSAAIGGVVAWKYDDYGSLAIVRIARTAYTAIDIGRTYKSMIYSQEWDTKSPEYIELRSKAHRICAEKLLNLCKANKGAYIKVGQHVGALDYLLPSEYVTTMRVLHNDAPKNSVEELYKVIREDLKAEPTELFTEFDPEPLGTASLAQVHRATLKDGTEVAVKVQHHFVRKNIKLDMQWMELVIKAMSKVFSDFQMQWLVEETKKNITKELDFLSEGKNAEKVAEIFKNYSWLKVPKIFWDYSTERVLVMEYVKGGQVNDLQYIENNKIDRMDLCRKIGDLYSHMIFVNGFVHSDPHPGNIIISKDSKTKNVTVYLLDHGLYANLTDKFRYHYSKLWLAIIARDRDEMRVHSEVLGIRKELYGLFACMVSGRPWESIMKGIDKTRPNATEKSIFQEHLPSLITQITECLEKVDREALLVLKTNDLIRSIEHTLKLRGLCGFAVMTKCCMQSIYELDYRNEKSVFKRQLLSIKYSWSIFIIYLYSIYLGIVNKV